MSHELIVSEVLNGDWVISIPNPEEEFCETQLARFNVASTEPGTHAHRAMIWALANTAAGLSRSLGRPVTVRSHSTDNRERVWDMISRMDAVMVMTFGEVA